MLSPGAGPDISRFGFVGTRIAGQAENGHDERVTPRLIKGDASSTAFGAERGYTVRMVPSTRKTTDVADLQPHPTHVPGGPLEPELSESYNAVQPDAFKGDEESAVKAAETDPDADDTIGAE